MGIEICNLVEIKLDMAQLRAAMDLAIIRLFENAQLLEDAGMENEAEHTYACAQTLRSTRKQLASCRNRLSRE